MLAAVSLLLPFPAGAADKAELQGQRGELRERIQSLQRDLAKSEESHASAADQLKATESAISAANRRLRELGESRAAIEAQIADLDGQGRRLDEESGRQRTQLARLLHRQYTRGETDSDALRQLLAGRDPNQIAFDDHLLSLLSRAKADLIADLRAKAAEKQRLADVARDKQAELAAIEQRQQEARAALLAQQRQRQTLLASLKDRIKAQRKEIGSLQRDEKRLAKLIEGLARLSPKAKSAPSPVRPAVPHGAPSAADLSGARGEFAALKGKLRLPVRGEIAARYGSPRMDGGTTWKGVFIRAPEGSEVKSVAAGRVAFADWLRGFGNLLIVDHGDGFLSVYGNNQSLLREAGDAVKAGEVVAMAGSSGGNPESGLYFELRYQGQTFDPLKWVAR